MLIQMYPCLAVKPNKGGQLSFARDTGKLTFLIGGKRAGKTHIGAWKAACLALGVHPLIKIQVPNAGWVCSTDYNQSRDVLQPRIISLIGEHNIAGWNELNKELYLKNGSLITFKSYDSGWEKFRSSGKHWIWFDEEPPERIFKESIIRFITDMPYIFVTMTPEFGITYIYKKYYQNQKETKASFHFCPTYQNVHLNKEEIELIKDQYTEEEYRMFLLGEFVPISGTRIFDLRKYDYNEILKNVGEPGYIVVENKRRWNERVKFVPNSSSNLTVYSHPKKGVQYFIGCDVGEGLPEGNYSTIEVIDSFLCQVAEYRARIPPDELSDILYAVGKYYNNALIGIERNNHGLTTISFLKRDYPTSLLWSSTHIQPRKDTVDTEKIGWETTEKTKAFLVDYLRRVVKDGSLDIKSPTLFEEMCNFVKDKKNKVGADYGCFDDLVMAMGIAVSMWFEKMYGKPRISIPLHRRIEKVVNKITGY